MIRVIVLILLLSSQAFGQTEGDSLYQVIDSLFKFSTTKINKYQDQVKPSKEALGEIGEPAVPYLVDKMDSQDARTMHALVDIFKIIKTPAVPYIVKAIADEDPYKRRLAVRALGDMKDSSAVDGLMLYVDDADFRIRAGILRALGKIGDQRGLEPSVKALQDDDYLVRTSAATSLSMLAAPETIDQLMSALSDEYYGVRFKAAEALWKIGKLSIKPITEALKNSPDKSVYYLLTEIAGNLKDKSMIKPLKEVLESTDPIARAFAVEALTIIDKKKANKIFRKKLKGETHPFVLGKINEASRD